MRIGIFGGTFDPPHLGHLRIAKAARHQLELDEVLFVPALKNPLKARYITSAHHRLEMVNRLIQSEPGLSASDVEIQRGDPSYMVETLEELSVAIPGSLWLILGSDALKDFMDWKQPEKIARLARLAVFERFGARTESVSLGFPAIIKQQIDPLVHAPINISSTELRDRIERNLPVGEWIPENVLQYIHEHKLYSNA